MMLVVATHFIARQFHGRGPDGRPEWPPTPTRLYQALLAGNLTGGRRTRWSDETADSFRWLERQPPPDIHAPNTRDERPMRRYVPTNDGDTVAAQWARGREPKTGMAALRSPMDWHPQEIDADGTVRYTWPIIDADRPMAEVITGTARYLVALGHGEDFAAGRGWLDPAPALPGQHYLPVDALGSSAPAPGLLDELLQRESIRASGGRAPPLSCVRRIGYVLDPSRSVRFRMLREGEPSYFEPAQARRIERAVQDAVAATAQELGVPPLSVDCKAVEYFGRIGMVAITERRPCPAGADVLARLVGAEITISSRRVTIERE